PGYSNRNYRCRQRRIRALLRSSRPVDRRRKISHYAETRFRQLRDFAFNRPVCRSAHDRSAYVHEHPRIETWQIGPEYFYDRETWRALRIDCARSLDWLARGRGPCKFWESLGCSRIAR